MRAGAVIGAATLMASAALAASAGRDVAAYAEGAPPGFSGGFGEQSCHACHFHAEPNSGAGRLSIAGVPERFVPGEQYSLTITLTRPGMKLGGFQATVRFKDGGAQAGAFTPAAADAARIAVASQGGVQYANQRRQGTELTSPDTTTWSLLWTAPKTGGPVQIHVAANAADGDETADGDSVHTTVVEASAQESRGVKESF